MLVMQLNINKHSGQQYNLHRLPRLYWNKQLPNDNTNVKNHL